MKPISFFALLMMLTLSTAQAQESLSRTFDVIVYPAEGQDSEQQEFDEYRCYKWAVNNTGYDPTTPQDMPSANTGPDGSMVKGAAGGAIIGALIGAIAGDAKKGAKIGAISGGTAGLLGKGAKDAATRAAVERAQEEQAAEFRRFKKAFCTCLEAKDYKATY